SGAAPPPLRWRGVGGGRAGECVTSGDLRARPAHSAFVGQATARRRGGRVRTGRRPDGAVLPAPPRPCCRRRVRVRCGCVATATTPPGGRTAAFPPRPAAG